MNRESEHTFVIPANEECPYLERCILSVLSQTVPSKILMTTATPNTFIQQLADKYHIPLLLNSQGGTISKNLSFAFAAADTPYITLAHQDDEYLPKFAERCLAFARKYDSSKPLIVFTKGKVVIAEKIYAAHPKDMLRSLLILPFHFKRCIATPVFKKSILLFANSISCPGVFYVKKNLPDFVFEDGLTYTLDWKAWYELSQKPGAFVYQSEMLHLHREHDGSTTSNTKLKNLKQEEFELLKLIWGNTTIARWMTTLLSFAK